MFPTYLMHSLRSVSNACINSLRLAGVRAYGGAENEYIFNGMKSERQKYAQSAIDWRTLDTWTLDDDAERDV